MEFFLHVDDAGVLIGEQLISHPEHLAAREAGFGDINCGAGEMRTDDVAFGVGGVVIGAHQTPLVLDGPDSGTDDERLVELSLMRARKFGKEIGRPGAAIAAILGQGGIDGKGGGLGHTDKQAARNPILEVGVVLNALESFFFRALILTDQRIVGAAQGVAGDSWIEDAGTLELCDLAGGGRDGVLGDRRSGKWVSGGSDRSWRGAGGRDGVGLGGGGLDCGGFGGSRFCGGAGRACL